MAAEPRALRLSILLTTFLVVAGSVAGFYLWFWARHADRAVPRSDPGLPPAGSLEPLPGTPPAVLERLRAAAKDLATSGNLDLRRRAEETLVAAGDDAVPVLLEAMEREAAAARGSEAVTRFRPQSRLDRALAAIRRERTPEDPAAPWRSLPDEEWSRRRVESWLAWWAAVRARTPGR